MGWQHADLLAAMRHAAARQQTPVPAADAKPCEEAAAVWATPAALGMLENMRILLMQADRRVGWCRYIKRVACK